MGVLALGAAPADAPSAVDRSVRFAVGTSLSNVIASALDRDSPPATRPGRSHGSPDTALLASALRRTLTP